MKSFIGNLLFIAILLLIATRFFSVISGTIFPINIVTAGSMSPSLMEGDLVSWIPADINDVEVGDVIVFKSWLNWPGEKLIIHRVVEVKEVWGEPAFLTKGDANDWTDQAGPHVTEPYVTEKNFIGKTLSIGKQPLKIPFIGLIGKWINDGFNLLSRPSASKGAYTYIGVFTPLSISVIFFVISIFIFPEREKNKTIREKIQYYIFGSKQLNLKTTFLFFFTIFVFLLVTIHFFAYDSISSSIGVGEFPDESGLKLGSIQPGQTNTPRAISIENQGVMPVKGIIFGEGEMERFIDRISFEIGPGTYKNINITATAPNGTINGSYNGAVMMYSSPLWFMFTNEILEIIYNFQAENAVIIIDILSSLILTCITLLLMILLTFLINKFQIWSIDHSWQKSNRKFTILRKLESCSLFRISLRKKIGYKLGWINNINLAEIDIKPFVIATIFIVPLLFFINSEIFAMVIASILSGIVAYFLSCKLRRKIVITSALCIIFAMIYAIFKINYLLINNSQNLIETISLSLGSVGLYLLILAIFLIPISLFSWFITNRIRNLNEQRDPLVILEGRCDL